MPALTQPINYQSYLWLLLFSRNSSGTYCLITPLKNALYLARKPFYREETCFAEEWLIGRRKTMTFGYFAYWSLMSFLIDDSEKRTHRNSWSRNMTGQTTTTSHLVMHLINTSLGADNRNRTRPVRLKECVTWTSNVSLSGSNNKHDMVGQQDLSHAYNMHQQ